MTAGPDFGYGSQPGEYGDISDFGYGAQPGEYGVDANHGLVPLLTGLQYGANQGPPPPPPPRRVRMPPTPRNGNSAVLRRRTRRLPVLVVASVIAVVALVLGYRAADRTSLHVGVSSHAAGPQREVVVVRLRGTLGWSHTTLAIGVIDAGRGRRLTVVRATGLCRLRRGQAALRAPRNRRIDGVCRLIVQGPPGRRHARVVVSVDGRARADRGIAIRLH